jgi:hypothetical protein
MENKKLKNQRIDIAYLRVLLSMTENSVIGSLSNKLNRDDSFGQDIPRLVWSLKVHYRVHKSRSVEPILCQLNTVHTITPSVCKILFNIILTYTWRIPNCTKKPAPNWWLVLPCTYKNIKLFSSSVPSFFHLIFWPGNKNSPTVTHACRKRRLKWVATLPLGDINTEAWFSGMGVGRGANNPTLWKENCWEASKKFSRILWRRPRPKLGCGAKESRRRILLLLVSLNLLCQDS